MLGRAEIEKAFDLNDQLRNVDAIFDRVFHTTTEFAAASGMVEKRACLIVKAKVFVTLKPSVMTRRARPLPTRFLRWSYGAVGDVRRGK